VRCLSGDGQGQQQPDGMNASLRIDYVKPLKTRRACGWRWRCNSLRGNYGSCRYQEQLCAAAQLGNPCHRAFLVHVGLLGNWSGRGPVKCVDAHIPPIEKTGPLNN